MWMIKSSLFFVFLNAFSFSAHSLDYPSALPNNNLEEEIQNEPDRMIPKSSWFSAAVDGHTYLRALGTKDFYHGVGYWIQGRTEFRPHDFFRLNVRSIFYSGSISGGYTEPTGQYHLVGLYGQWPELVLGGKLEGRTMDIERQTIGQGLMIEEKEMAGVWFKWSRNGHSVRLLGEGTGGLLLDDDLYNLEINLFEGYFALGVLGWKAGNQSGLPRNRDSLYYLSSAHEIASSGVGYFLEAGSRNSKFAGLVGLKSENTFGRLRVKSRIQSRNYEDGFADQFVGSIEHVYVSYDQYDKRFTNAANVFVLDDEVEVHSLVLDMEYELNEKCFLQSKNETGVFDYENGPDTNFYYYRAGITFFPLANRKESFTIFSSNKVLTDSYARPPDNRSLVNRPLFKQENFFGMEAAFRF